MASAGLLCSISPSTVDRSVVAASSRFGSTAPMRDARIRTCACDSSPEIYSTVLRSAKTGHVAGGFQQQCRFADAWLACDERHGAGYDAAAEYAVEFRETRADSGNVFRADFRDGLCGGSGHHMRLRARCAPGGRGAFRSGGTGLMKFLDGAPLAAFGAAAQPFRAVPAAFGTYKL